MIGRQQQQSLYLALIRTKMPFDDVSEAYLWRSVSECDLKDDVSHHQIPVIDYSDKRVVEKIGPACRSFGAFQIVGHGVDNELMSGMEEQANRVFSLPMEKKLKASRSPGSVTGYGAARISSSCQKLMWSEGFTLDNSPSHVASKLWPSHSLLYDFCKTVEDYNSAMLKVARNTMSMVLESLGVKEENEQHGCGVTSDHYSALQLNHYPPSPRPSRTIGMAEHTDSTFLTILNQGSSNVHALQIKISNGLWIPVPPIRGALVVNVGDLLQVVSNGKYESVVHRVVSSRERRVSMAYLWGPPLEQAVECPTQLVDSQHPRLYRSLTWDEYLKVRSSLKFCDALRSFRLP